MTTQSVEERLQAITAAIEQARANRANAQARREQAQAAINREMESMQRDFGISTVEEAQAMLAELDANIEKEAQSLEDAMRRATE